MRFVCHAARIRVPLSVPRPKPPLQLRHTPLGWLPPLLWSALCLAIVNWQQAAAGSQVILNKHIFQASQRKHFLLPRLPSAPLLLSASESSKQNLLLVFGTKQTVAEAAAEA